MEKTKVLDFKKIVAAYIYFWKFIYKLHKYTFVYVFESVY